MDTESLLPLVTFILGLGGALVTEAFRDRRASNRERQARQAELQRSTLLGLQDALLELSNVASQLSLAALATTLEDLDEDSRAEAETQRFQVWARLWGVSSKTRLLISRVQDDQARQDASALLRTADMVRSLDRETAEENLGHLHSRYGKVVDRLGELLRERY